MTLIELIIEQLSGTSFSLHDESEQPEAPGGHSVRSLVVKYPARAGVVDRKRINIGGRSVSRLEK